MTKQQFQFQVWKPWAYFRLVESVPVAKGAKQFLKKMI